MHTAVRARSRTDLLPWLALAAGFSPVIAEFVRGFTANYSPPSTLLAPVLIAVCLWRGAELRHESRRAGAALIALGLVLELIGIATRAWTLAWISFPVAAVGLALWLGRPSWTVAVLGFGLVPVPVSIQALTTPTVETALLSGVCAGWRALGLAISCTGPVAHVAHLRLELNPDDAGWTLVAVLAELGWFVAVSRGASARDALRTALLFAAAVVVVQPLAVALALGLLAMGSEGAARVWLSQGVWLACTVGVLFWSRGGALQSRRGGGSDRG